MRGQPILPMTRLGRRAWHPAPRSYARGNRKLFMMLERFGSPSRTRTCDKAINSRLLYQLSYRGPRRGLYTRLWRDARPLRIFVGFVYGLASVWPPVAESPLRTGPGLCKRPVTPDRPSDPEAPFPHRWDVREASWRSGYAEDCKSLHPGSIPGEASKLSDTPDNLLVSGHARRSCEPCNSGNDPRQPDPLGPAPLDGRAGKRSGAAARPTRSSFPSPWGPSRRSGRATWPLLDDPFLERLRRVRPAAGAERQDRQIPS